jgi:hypothetical protein
MNHSIPAGDWVTVEEAQTLVPDVSSRRLQALAASSRVLSVKVLGRVLLDRADLIAWRDSRKPGRPRKEED